MDSKLAVRHPLKTRSSPLSVPFGISRATVSPSHRALGLLGLFAVLLATAAGCGSSGEGASAEMEILSCTLGCHGPEDGPLGCAITEVFVNQGIWVEFSNSVDPNSLTPQTFQIIESATGISPPGTLQVDPGNSRRARFSPSLTFDSTGAVSFGLRAGSNYRFLIPGVSGGGDGPFLTDTNGSPNLIQLDCMVNTALEPLDLVPGAPRVTTFLDLPPLASGPGEAPGIDGASSKPSMASAILLEGAAEVPIGATLRFEFDDLMNPSTLANPVTKTSSTLRVLVDLDGSVASPEDQLLLPGEYELLLDEQSLRTTVLFTPSSPLPTAGTDSISPRLILVEVPAQISDLGGNPILNPGTRIFTPETAFSDPTELRSGFDDLEGLDPMRSSSSLEPDLITIESMLEDGDVVGQVEHIGRAAPGLGGGLGLLGDLEVVNGSPLVLSTGPEIPTRFGPTLESGPVDSGGAPAEDAASIAAYHVRATVVDPVQLEGLPEGVMGIEVRDGVFEFASLDVELGGELSFVGEQAPRIFVRGEARVRGLITVTGEDAWPHDSLAGFGGAGGCLLYTSPSPRD